MCLSGGGFYPRGCLRGGVHPPRPRGRHPPGPRGRHPCPIACWDTPPPAPMNRMTDRCKNITLPQTSFEGGKKEKATTKVTLRATNQQHNSVENNFAGSSYDTDDSLGLRVSHLLNGENIRMQLRNRLPKDSSETRSSADNESQKTEGLLKPVSVNTDVNSNDTSKKYSPGAKSGSSSKTSTLKEEDFKSGGYEAVNVPMELPVVDPARERGRIPTQQQAAEYPELEGIERMNPALSVNNWQQREPKSAQKQEVMNAEQRQMRDDSFMNALSRLGEGVDPEIMERIARKAFVQQQMTQQEVPVPDGQQTPLNQSQLTDRSLDSLSNRVNLLLSETVSIGAKQGHGKYAVESSSSSRRSSQTSGSINYDMLQRELDDIQSGLMALQKGDLSIKYAIKT